jgi:hypothetical protein
MSSTELLLNEARRIRDSGVLGEARLRQLFDYLVEQTVAGESPKELVIAMDVFGKDAAFNVGEDALVRVYMHKLRKALTSFYHQSGLSFCPTRDLSPLSWATIIFWARRVIRTRWNA